ncbi:cytochrome c and c1 heme-lyase [Meira miltonrushii]|uniref:Holocytochrome c-type synthase n=1 Tax=Meira miltonrushii TaxID=1280837 RepID=A0A316VIT7_9BASI|nr:cytochrome c and c1 heme-lyase [Meira miltonrushii]PWN37420.1 cytochrome c and c1 heme-lyase [Meira miltonrushii]
MTSNDASACPVDHETRSAWLAQQKGDQHKAPGHLSTDRVISSIPRFGASAKDDSSQSAPVDPSTQANWVYPSPAQFYSAMARKNHNPQEQDMNVVVPIHNAVNERAWQQILQWERIADKGKSYQTCGGPQLVSFKGKPQELTWRAWFKTFLGYERPFDRHDWEVDRCGKRVRYIIDFYSGRSDMKGLAFYLDVRPAPSDWEGIRMRFLRFWSRPPQPPKQQ